MTSESIDQSSSFTGLTSSQLASARDYNSDRPYSSELWKAVQRVIGASPDGVPGPDTASKVAAWQAANQAGAPDGKAGPETLSSMGVGPMFVGPGVSFFYPGSLEIDADGAPNAYNPDDTGLDYNANAGIPGECYGVATVDGEPYVQTEGLYKGYYVSTTSLCDTRYGSCDIKRYVDSTAIPYIVLPGNISDLIPGATGAGLKKGDLAAVALMNSPDNVVFAIYADVGPRRTKDRHPLQPGLAFGEGSVKLSQMLGHDPIVVRSGVKRASSGLDSGLIYVVFPGTGVGAPMSFDDIQQKGGDAFAQWGGGDCLRAAIDRIQRSEQL
jgi:peptidoglycan hydrolase-like protein with peptidoglycan-binding domain